MSPDGRLLREAVISTLPSKSFAAVMVSVFSLLETVTFLSEVEKSYSASILFSSVRVMLRLPSVSVSSLTTLFFSFDMKDGMVL